jgi:mannose/cellobiose epimerase-like protein (N-acyl-D-glucosamine 2-epimerase family)
MTERLQQAVAQATARVAQLAEQAERLPPDEQDELAARIEVLANELRWEELLNDPSRAAAIDALAEEALADLAAGRTRPLSEVFGDDAL